MDYTVEVFIVHNNKVLLRKHDKYGIWLGVGGHIELDEDPIEAAIRECKEEVGLDVTILGLAPKFENTVDRELIAPIFMNRHNINDTHEHIALVYAAQSETNYVTESDLEMSQGLKWFSQHDLDNPNLGIMDNIIHYAKKALDVAKQQRQANKDNLKQ
jgi:8-oxo-dGTP pyrophosphatase MutT (NUDIX family)